MSRSRIFLGHVGSAASPELTAVVDQALGAATPTATATVASASVATVTLGGATPTASATVASASVVTVTLGVATSTISASLALSGEVAQTLGSATATASVTAAAAAVVNVTLDAATLTSAADILESRSAVVDVSLNPATSVLNCALRIYSSVTDGIVDAIADAPCELGITCSVDTTLSSATLSAHIETATLLINLDTGAGIATGAAAWQTSGTVSFGSTGDVSVDCAAGSLEFSASAQIDAVETEGTLAI